MEKKGKKSLQELLSKKDRVFFKFYNKKKGRASECTALSLVVHALEVLRKGMRIQNMKLRSGFLTLWLAHHVMAGKHVYTCTAQPHKKCVA